ncbi:MAG: site-specific integrase [Sedimenticola sp.]
MADSKPDTKYLKLRGSVWWFQRAVPSELQKRYGKVIQETLSTSDLKEAQKRRDVKSVQWTLTFDKDKKELAEALDPPSRSEQAEAILQQLQGTLSYLLNHDHIPESERMGMDWVVTERADKVLVDLKEETSLSVQRQILQLTRLILLRLNDPMEFNPAEARELLAEDAVQKSMPELRDEFIGVKTKEKLPDKTIKTHKRHLKALEDAGWDAQVLVEGLEEDNKSSTTIKNYLTNINTFARWLGKKGVVLEVPKLRQKQFAKTRDVFTHEELQKIASYPMDRASYWVTMVTMHHGFRAGETLQLQHEDVRELHGYWCFEIHDREGKSAKNESTVRRVPVHPWLVENGFLDYWDKSKGWGATWKSYDGTASQGFSKHINKIIKTALGMESSDTPTGKKVFHSMRHTFRDYCREAGVSTEMVNQLGGWSNKGMGEGVGYGQGHSTQKQYEALSTVIFLP